jgi:anti-sigma B factor antagonist
MTEENLEITQNIQDGVCKISVKGRIDSNTSDSLLTKLEAAIEEGNKNIILNMYNVKYLSSVGIRIILKTYKSLSEEGGSFKIERPSDTVKNVLGMVALQEMLVTN